MNEFELIEHFFRKQSGPSWLTTGIGDDGAVLLPPAGQQVIVTDTLNESIHFFPETPAAAVGHKALAVNLSDLAAMGAQPQWFTLNLSLPEFNQTWLAEFSDGLFALAKQHQIALIGGDTCRGPLSISITAAGFIPPEQRPLTRSAARVGDRLFVAGALGRAALAVTARKQGLTPTAACAQALDFPQPQLSLALQWRTVMRAAIDVSDGLLADLAHITEQSSLGFVLDGEVLEGLLPTPNLLGAQALLTGGDDYALLFTLPAEVDAPKAAICIGSAISLEAEGAGLNSRAIRLDGGSQHLQQAFAQASQEGGFVHF